jgi:dCTP deaminase
MILTDKSIIDEMANNNIVIRPYKHENLGTNSYDLTLSPNLLIYTDKVLDVKKKNESTVFEIAEEGIVLQPGILYLASSNEYTETLKHVPIIQGKSSLGRLGLFVHVTAGFGDVGFKGHWTLELVAVQPIRIYPNMKIAQITYLEASETPYTDYGSKADAKYNNQGALPKSSEMMKNF